MTSSSPSTPTPSAWLFLIAPFFLWGTAMVAMKGVLPDTTPMFVATVRLIPAGVLVLLVAAWQGRSQPDSWQGWGWISLFALIDATCFQGFLAQGLARTGAGLGSVIIDSQPIAVALMSSWLFKEVIGAMGWLGLALGIFGIGLIGLPDEWFYQLWQSQSLVIAWSAEAVWQSGEVWMLLASLSMAIGTVLIPFVSRRVDPVVATGWHMIIGGLPLMAIALWQDSQPWQDITLWGWGDLAYATIFGSALAYGIFFYLASKGNLTSLSALTFLTPIFALSFGNLLLGEQLSPLQWVGVGFTLISIYLINQRAVIT
ncbi:MAG: DMT family transporter, partial [Synechocystis sp.]|nr:DMT family transporter [Synechocystis sp.]